MCVGLGAFAVGSYIDFASDAGFNWWKASCRAALLEHGATALWNDNNEYEVHGYRTGSPRRAFPSL